MDSAAATFPILSGGAPRVPAHVVDRASASQRVLGIAVAGWFIVAAIGQLLFVAYIAGFYGRTAIVGDFAAWNRVMPHGHVEGDLFGNLVVGSHVLFAALVTLAGLLQLVPQVRRDHPRVHRLSGRFYVIAAATLAIGGATMIAHRGAIGDPLQTSATLLNALMILVFAGLAWRAARARRFDVHRRWALRLFLVVGGVWFFRIGLSGWLLANGGPVGFDPKTFTGPALTILAFSQTLVPLLVLEGYLRARASRVVAAQYAMGAVLGACTLATAGGIVAATLILWLPRV